MRCADSLWQYQSQHHSASSRPSPVYSEGWGGGGGGGRGGAKTAEVHKRAQVTSSTNLSKKNGGLYSSSQLVEVSV